MLAVFEDKGLGRWGKIAYCQENAADNHHSDEHQKSAYGGGKARVLPDQ